MKKKFKIILICVAIILLVLTSILYYNSKIEDRYEGEIVNCLPEQRNVDACIEIYEPVCATVNVQCVTTPCPPIKETFSNSCFACSNPLVEGYIEGEC